MCPTNTSFFHVLFSSVDVTGNTVDVSAACMSLNKKSCNRSTSYSTSCMFEVNPAFASISGNPFMENDERYYMYIYYIDKSVLVENRPRVKFIRNYIRDSSGVFSIPSLVRISMTSFLAFTLLFVQKYSSI